MRSLFLLVCVLASSLAAQSRPSGSAGRPWVSAGLVGGRQTFGCGGCRRGRSMGAVGLTGGTGITLPHNLGVGVVLHGLVELSGEFSQRSRFALLVGQYAIPSARFLTVNAGLGLGRYRGDETPYIHHGNGTVGSAGFALRLPPASVAGLSISATYVRALTGMREESSGGAKPLFLPRLLLFGGALSLAGASLVDNR